MPLTHPTHCYKNVNWVIPLIKFQSLLVKKCNGLYIKNFWLDSGCGLVGRAVASDLGLNPATKDGIMDRRSRRRYYLNGIFPLIKGETV